MEKIYITGNITDSLAKEVARQIQATRRYAYNDNCINDNSSFKDVANRINKATKIILIIDPDEDYSQQCLAFKIGYILGGIRRKLYLFIMDAADKDSDEYKKTNLKLWYIESDENENETAKKICNNLFDKWEHERKFPPYRFGKPKVG